jgi:hypothetical protein
MFRNKCGIITDFKILCENTLVQIFAQKLVVKLSVLIHDFC